MASSTSTEAGRGRGKKGVWGRRKTVKKKRENGKKKKRKERKKVTASSTIMIAQLEML